MSRSPGCPFRVLPPWIRAGLILAPLALAARAEPAPVVWKFDNLAQTGGQPLTVLGAPKIDPAGAALVFNGSSDGVEVPANPIQGWSRFTIAVRFSPARDGQAEQRFFHIQQTVPASRTLLEIRLDHDGNWSLDGYLAAGAKGLVLLDRSKTHPAGRWYWVALVYDGARMATYVNGVLQGEGKFIFPPMASGSTSVGVRMNRVYWFKGEIGEARFYPFALEPSALPR